MVIFDNILHRMRFSKFLALLSEEFDEECVEILEDLLQHGRSSLEQIISRARSKINEGDCDVESGVRVNFQKLVCGRYIERCPDSEAVSVVYDEGGKSHGGNTAEFAEPKTIEQQVLASAIPSERFIIEAHATTRISSEANVNEKPLNVTVGEKRKGEDLEMDDGAETMISEKEVLWRANFEEFVDRLRHKACVVSVRSRYDDGAVIVLNAILEATRKAEGPHRIERSVSLTRDDILKEVKETKEGHNMTPEDVVLVLRQLNFYGSAVGNEESYCVDLKDIVEVAQNNEVESLVSKRYGNDAYKMFRLLSMTGKLMETNKISYETFVEKKEALKILYNLWKDNYLHMEKIVAHGSTQSQFLLWKINKRAAREHVFDEMCHAALNLRLRMAYELEQENAILELPKDKRVGEEGKKYERARKVKTLLESSLMQLDEALMLFHDF